MFVVSSLRAKFRHHKGLLAVRTVWCNPIRTGGGVGSFSKAQE